MKFKLVERYPEDSNIITADFKKQLNKICNKYSGWKYPQEIAPLWKELSDLGIEVLITGAPTSKVAGGKSWTVTFDYNGEPVDNSRFVYDVYEGSNSLKNDYNMYFS